MKSVPRFPSLFFRQYLNCLSVSFLAAVVLLLLCEQAPLSVLAAVVGALALLLTAAFQKLRYHRIALLFAAFGIALALLAVGSRSLKAELAVKASQGEGECTGYVTHVDEDGFDLKTTSLQGKTKFVKIRVCSEEKPRFGDRVCLTLSEARAADGAAASEGVVLLAEGEDVVRLSSSVLLSLVGDLRTYLTQVFGEGETGTFLSAILLGERSGLPASLSEAFRRTASSHLLAISGLHVTTIMGFLYFAARAFRIDRRAVNGIAVPTVLLLILLTGLSVSVIRAGVMMLMTLLAYFSRRKSDPTTALFLAALLIVLWEPRAVFSASFLLSFLSTLSILTVSAPLSAYLESLLGGKKTKGTWERLLMRLCALFLLPVLMAAASFLFTLPVQFLLFEETCLLAPIYAVILIPLFAPCLVLGLLWAVLSAVPAVSFAVGFAARGYSAFFLFLTRSLSAAAPEPAAVGAWGLPLALFCSAALLFFMIVRAPLSRFYYAYPALFLICLVCAAF
ncbi:MAG: ComEC/Rec2 family competence protein [Clostridia bacterium]|nr:ComEC/Rec2 family competence protein [Clostridia bacterium]